MFRLLCLSAAISACIYCTYEYSKNQDFSEVSFKLFNQDDMSLYPQMSLCFLRDHYLDEELKKINEQFNASTYEKFLSGSLWDPRLLHVDIRKATLKVEDYILDTCIQSRIMGNCHKGTISSGVFLSGYRCVSFHYRYPRRIFYASMWVNSSIFDGGLKLFNGQGFILVFSFPGQILRLSSVIGANTLQYNSSTAYVMQFSVKNVEVLRRRNKRGSHCNDKEKYDTYSDGEIVSQLGCRPFYMTSYEKYPICDTKEKMAQTIQASREVASSSFGLVKIKPPCSEIQRLDVEYKHEETNAEKENILYTDKRGKLENDQGWFRVGVKFWKNEFKEIKQLRAYSLQSLIGNAGGYIGLLVGYTVAELPHFFATLYRIISKTLQKYC